MNSRSADIVATLRDYEPAGDLTGELTETSGASRRKMACARARARAAPVPRAGNGRQATTPRIPAQGGSRGPEVPGCGVCVSRRAPGDPGAHDRARQLNWR